MTSKVVEAHAQIHSLAMAVAVRSRPSARGAFIDRRSAAACDELVAVWCVGCCEWASLLLMTWRADSIYTERYMKTPHLNKYGYENSSIHITDGFRNSQFLLAQGSGDDNVHFQNSAHLLDLLQGAKIRNFWFEMFPDSSHSISKRGATRELYEFLTKFLVYNWGAGGKRVLRYENDKGLSTVL